MASPIAALAEVVGELNAMWPDDAIDALTPDDAFRAHEKLARARRLIDAADARFAASISHHSRPELGPDSLAKKQGFRNAKTLIAATMGSTAGEANKLVQVGEATEPRMTLTGHAASSRHPHVGEALAQGTISLAVSSAIIKMLDGIALRAGHDQIDTAEKLLAEQAEGLTLDQLSRLLLRTQAWLDPDGVEPREEELRDGMSLHIRREVSGAIVFTGRYGPECAAPIVTAVEGYVTAQLQAQHDALGPQSDPDSPRRSIAQLQAEALMKICEHMLGCKDADAPLAGATVVVRIDLADLIAGTGHATIDGIDAPISAATARRMAASADIIPAVLGGDSEILDWGRKRRLFTKTQKLAATERDGGCAGCGAPPGHTKVHHLEWWSRGGRTDLDCAILLCDSCHHRVHDNGWEIQIDGTGVHATVWFIPPPWIDPDRTPRRGANREHALATALTR